MTSNPFNFYPKRWRPGSNSRARAANRAWHAPRPRAWAVVVEAAPVEVTADTEQNLQRTAGLWGTRRPSGGRAARALARGRRRTQRVRPLGAAPNPNLACRAVVDYIADGQYGLILIERGCAPAIVMASDNPGKVLYQASRFLQPGLIASVSEGVLLAVKLIEPTWNLNGPGTRPSSTGIEGPGLFGSLPATLLGASLERPGLAGDGFLTIAREWLNVVFGPELSKRQWRRLRHQTRGLRKLRERTHRSGETPRPAPEQSTEPAPDSERRPDA
jgi:hypothetical protein